MKTVSGLISTIHAESVIGKTDLPVSGLCTDSRQAGKNSAFFAIPGIHVDRHDYIKDVVKNGASLIVHQKELDEYAENVCYVRVEDIRKTMAPIAAAFYDHPADELHVIGVTGTDGKSSTVYFLTQLLELAGIKSGCISTVMVKTGGDFIKNPFRQSTPDAPEIQRYLREMADSGCKVAVIEATSHGLSEKNSRLTCVSFNTGILTHISHEHLEFHGTMEKYIDDKANLFRFVKETGGTAILNAAEVNSTKFASVSGPSIVYYSASVAEADVYAENIEKTDAGYAFDLYFFTETIPAEIRLPGRFNIDNCLAALAAVHEYSGIPAAGLAELLPALKPLKGRMNAVDKGQPFTVIVDYAHSPGSFEKQFPVWKEETENRLIAVFGSAGERDTAKRPLQAKIASKYSDIIILANEDPRGEDEMKILEDIAAGCPARTRNDELYLIPDRRTAIRKALELAEKGDYLVFLGKGHENSIIYKNSSIDWDEYTIISEELEKMGYSG